MLQSTSPTGPASADPFACTVSTVNRAAEAGRTEKDPQEENAAKDRQPGIQVQLRAVV